MEEDKEELKDVVLGELKRLGVGEVVRKKSHHLNVTQGSKLLGINTTSNIKSTNFRSKSKNKRSPRLAQSRSPLSKKANRTKDERKHKPRTPKSPFSTSKRKAEQRKQNAREKVSATTPGHVFGQKLENVPSVCVYMTDGTQVTVPEFLVDVCNLIRRNITVEGIFRKAGSSQRQSDLKKLIDNDGNLPSNIHVIDGACLLKQFLRCFPEPLLPSDVHSKIIRCMELNEELKVEAITLCTLLLPETHRHVLIYLLDFLIEVAASSSSNLMDAHNLAIVLAPNLLPTSITPSTSRKNFEYVPSEDVILTTNIEILQLMIENGSHFCRMPPGLALALEHREKSKSTENLLQSQPNSAARKKRRSASIHRLMTGLRRVVGHSSTSGSPLKASESVEYLDTLHQHPGIALSPAPMPSISPRKRKSADAFDLCPEMTRDAAGELHRIPTPPSSKRVRVEREDSAAKESVTPSARAFAIPATPPVASNNLPVTVVTCATPSERQSLKMGQPLSIREVKDSRDLFPQSSHGTITKSTLEESLSSQIRTLSKSPRFNIHSVHNGVTRRSFDRVEPIGQPKEDPRAYPRAFSELCMEVTPVKKAVKVKRRSCDVPLGGGAKRAGNFENPQRVVRRNSFDWRSSGNEPDGADVSTLGPRGIPDGAECNLRDKAPPKPSASGSLETLEQHYDDIKAVVKSMEAEVDKSNVEQMKETYFPNNSSSSENMSYSEMIQNAYERMKVETKDLGMSPSQNLSKRLDKELKIRKRRSSEHRVIRSPSERKIGTIRRRSRELVQNAAKSLIAVEDTPKAELQQTPKMKEHLIQTPVNGSLRRGKPNSVKSGLPLVVRSFSPMQKEDEAATSSNRTVVVSKRSLDNLTLQPLKVSNKSPYHSLENSRNNSDSDMKGSFSDLSSINLDASKDSKENLMDSIIELLPGPMTRRRSSLLSSLASSFPILQVSSSDNFSDGETLDSSCSPSKISNDNNLSGMDEQDVSPEKKGNLASVPSPRVVVLPTENDESRIEDWIPASDFIYTREDEPQETLTCDTNHGRPSLAALMKQKKVTANVQLFNNLHTTTPVCQDNDQLGSTPKQSIMPRSTASERRNVRLSYSRSLNSRSTLTPRELLKARQRSFQFDKSPRNLAKIAVVSPLKESTWINIQQEHAHEVQKAFKGEATIPQPPLVNICSENSFKPPVAPVTPVRPHNQFKIFRKKLESPPTNPPKLPPRNIVKPSPIRVQYR